MCVPLYTYAGDKLRICGAELTSPGPGEPLQAAATGGAPCRRWRAMLEGLLEKRVKCATVSNCPTPTAAVLSISANNTHAALTGARLGRQRRRAVFVPLGHFDEGGGPMPQTLVVLHRWAWLAACARSQASTLGTSCTLHAWPRRSLMAPPSPCRRPPSRPAGSTPASSSATFPTAAPACTRPGSTRLWCRAGVSGAIA